MAPHWGASGKSYGQGCYFVQAKAIWHGNIPSEYCLGQASHDLKCKNNLHCQYCQYRWALENVGIDIASGI